MSPTMIALVVTSVRRPARPVDRFRLQPTGHAQESRGRGLSDITSSSAPLRPYPQPDRNGQGYARHEAQTMEKSGPRAPRPWVRTTHAKAEAENMLTQTPAALRHHRELPRPQGLTEPPDAGRSQGRRGQDPGRAPLLTPTSAISIRRLVFPNNPIAERLLLRSTSSLRSVTRPNAVRWQ